MIPTLYHIMKTSYGVRSCTTSHRAIKLNEWRHFEDTVDTISVENQKLNDYYECLIECEITHQNSC